MRSGTGGVGTPSVDELCEQVLDRLRIGSLVHAIERLAAPPRQERPDELVREDHQLLDEHVGVRLAFEPGIGDAAFAVEAERDLGRLHLQRAAREALRSQLAGQLVVQVERGQDLGGASRRCASPYVSRASERITER